MRVAGNGGEVARARRWPPPPPPPPPLSDGPPANKQDSDQVERKLLVAKRLGLAEWGQRGLFVIEGRGQAAARRSLVIRRRQQSSKRPGAEPLAGSALMIIFLALLQALRTNIQAQALQITNFRVPAFVPANLATTGGAQQQLAKPILFDCDYDYRPEEDERLTVKWFKNKEAEPFYQWLPELDVRHFADWIKPLLNQSFVSDPHDPLKRYRSLLLRRLSLNLTGQYTCLVSSLAGQDMRQASLVVYQPPRSFTFQHRVFPAPAALLAPSPLQARQQQQQQQQQQQLQLTRPPPIGFGPPSPTQFKGLGSPGAPATIVRPPNNNNSLGPPPAVTSVPPPATSTRIVYTHDGRPIRRKTRRQLEQAEGPPISSWQLHKRLGPDFAAPLPPTATIRQNYALQLHQFQCQASQVTPRPVIVLTVKRDAESIAQYLHESSLVNIRAHQVGGGRGNASAPGEPLVTLFDITVSATVALNVSLPFVWPADAGQRRQLAEQQMKPPELGVPANSLGVNTILNFRRGQRMSFECHLEITGTEFERRERINIDEQEVYRFAEAEEERRRARLEQQQRRRPADAYGQAPASHRRSHLREQPGATPPGDDGAGLLSAFGLAASSSSAAPEARPAEGLLLLPALTSAFAAFALAALARGL